MMEMSEILNTDSRSHKPVDTVGQNSRPMSTNSSHFTKYNVFHDICHQTYNATDNNKAMIKSRILYNMDHIHITCHIRQMGWGGSTWWVEELGWCAGMCVCVCVILFNIKQSVLRNT